VGTPVTCQNIVITFLAILELIRRRRVRVYQGRASAEILIRPIPNAQPVSQSSADAD